MVYFGENKIDWLRKFYPYKNGISSYDVLNTVFNELNNKEFNSCFISWVNSIADISQGRLVVIDGKTILGLISKYGKSNLHIVSAFCSKNGICVGQKVVDDKSSEIIAISKNFGFISF